MSQKPYWSLRLLHSQPQAYVTIINEDRVPITLSSSENNRIPLVFDTPYMALLYIYNTFPEELWPIIRGGICHLSKIRKPDETYPLALMRPIVFTCPKCGAYIAGQSEKDMYEEIAQQPAGPPKIHCNHCGHVFQPTH